MYVEKINEGKSRKELCLIIMMCTYSTYNQYSGLVSPIHLGPGPAILTEFHKKRQYFRKENGDFIEFPTIHPSPISQLCNGNIGSSF